MTSRLQAYFDTLRKKKLLVLGVGVSNRPLVRLLLRFGLDVTCCDKTPRTQLDEELLELERLGAKLHLGAGYLQDLSGDVAFRTPGLHPGCEELVRLRARGTRITSEMEAFFEVCPCSIIAVTGSDGKTTTATLIAELLKKQGERVWLGGNIGTPLLDKADLMQPQDKVVLELSSFQLLDFPHSPHTAVVTNLAPNHLDIHTSMEEYIQAKQNVFAHQTAADTLIVNMDNDITDSFAAQARGRVLKFSRKGEPEQGVFLRDGIIYRKNGSSCERLLEQKSILLPGLHNVENYMAAIAAVGSLVSDENIRLVAEQFGGVEHRIELVRVKDGVSYYNDSIASSPSRTIAGLRSFPGKVILIAGGYDKQIPYRCLGPEIVEHVRILIATGATGPKIKAATEEAAQYRPGTPAIYSVSDFFAAVHKAAELAQPGDVVLLSPASAAFDQFKNFMVRGKAFKKTVMEL